MSHWFQGIAAYSQATFRHWYRKAVPEKAARWVGIERPHGEPETKQIGNREAYHERPDPSRLAVLGLRRNRLSGGYGAPVQQQIKFILVCEPTRSLYVECRI